MSRPALRLVPDEPGPLRRAQGRLRGRGRSEPVEASLSDAIAAAAPTRFNVAGVVSVAGGVGKTTLALGVAGLIARIGGVRTVVIDASSDYASAGAAGAAAASASTVADFLEASQGFLNPAELRAFVTPLPGGAHLVAGGPDDPPLTAERAGELLGKLAPWYELAIIDCSSGITAELPRHTIARADQLLLVSTPQQAVSSASLRALDHLPTAALTVALNHAQARGQTLHDIAEVFDAAVSSRGAVAVPDDPELDRLASSVDLDVEALSRSTRTALFQLAASVATQLH